MLRSPSVMTARPVPRWGVVSSALAPVLLTGAWTAAADLQPRPFNAISESVSALAAVNAPDRWVMTLAFIVSASCEIATGLALRPAAPAGRGILMTGGGAGVLVALSPQPGPGGFSLAHAVWASVGLAALTVWPAAAARDGRDVPWALRHGTCVAVTVVLGVLLLWFSSELLAGGGEIGLAERVLGTCQATWPLVVVLACRRSQARAWEAPS